MRDRSLIFLRINSSTFHVSCLQNHLNYPNSVFKHSACWVKISANNILKHDHTVDGIPSQRPYWLCNHVLLFFPENRLWHFMQTVSLGKNQKNIFNLSPAELAQSGKSSVLNYKSYQTVIDLLLHRNVWVLVILQPSLLPPDMWAGENPAWLGKTASVTYLLLSFQDWNHELA